MLINGTGCVPHCILPFKLASISGFTLLSKNNAIIHAVRSKYPDGTLKTTHALSVERFTRLTFNDRHLCSAAGRGGPYDIPQACENDGRGSAS